MSDRQKMKLNSSYIEKVIEDVLHKVSLTSALPLKSKLV